MELGGPGRDGFLENHWPDDPDFSPDMRPCWKSGELVLIRYEAQGEGLTAIYRCETETLGGQLNVNYRRHRGERSYVSSYVFSIFDPKRDPGLDHIEGWPN